MKIIKIDKTVVQTYEPPLEDGTWESHTPYQVMDEPDDRGMVPFRDRFEHYVHRAHKHADGREYKIVFEHKGTQYVFEMEDNDIHGRFRIQTLHQWATEMDSLIGCGVQFAKDLLLGNVEE